MTHYFIQPPPPPLATTICQAWSRARYIIGLELSGYIHIQTTPRHGSGIS